MMTIANVFTKLNYDFDRIETLYLRIINLDARNYAAYGKLAQLYQKRNQTNNALKYYKKAIELHPEFEFTNKFFLEFMQQLNEKHRSTHEKPIKKKKMTKTPKLVQT